MTQAHFDMTQKKLTICEVKPKEDKKIYSEDTVGLWEIPMGNKAKDILLLIICLLTICIIIGECFQYFRTRAHQNRSPSRDRTVRKSAAVKLFPSRLD